MDDLNTGLLKVILLKTFITFAYKTRHFFQTGGDVVGNGNSNENSRPNSQFENSRAQTLDRDRNLDRHLADEPETEKYGNKIIFQ